MKVCVDVQKWKEVEEKVNNQAIEYHEGNLMEMNKYLVDWEGIIKNKEKDIEELWVKNSHLENFRFVLDHKIKTL